MAAHHYIEAGTEWRGVTHPQRHAHKDNVRLLSQAGASEAVSEGWRNLESLRPGNIYGGHINGKSSAEARKALKIIKEWAEAGRPHP